MGFPIIIRSDGGPCFKSHAFQEWCRSLGIRHVRSAPGHHESNGAAECGIRGLKALMKTTDTSGFPLQKLILQLNNMVRTNEMGSPNQMFFAKNIRIPGIPALNREEVNCQKMAERRMNKREVTRQKADRGLKPTVRTFEIGDRVRYFDERSKHWRNFGEMLDFRTHGSSMIQSYYTINERGEEILRPRMHVAEQ